MLFLWVWGALAGDVRVDVLDVGQGDSILIRTPANKVVLIDAGDGQVAVAPMLTALGVDHIDLLVGTHPHADHIGGIDEVFAALPVKRYVDSGLPHTTQTYERVMTEVEGRGIPYQTAVTGQTFNLDDGARLEVLFPRASPLTGTRSDLNANSVVTRLVHGDDCFLFTGDAEEPTERALLDAGIGPCEVLKVAHHGSDHSTTAAFLAAVKPRIGLVSAGAANRYGHPGAETMARLEAAGVEVHRTDLEGTIRMVSTGSGIRLAPPQERAVAAAPPIPPTPVLPTATSTSAVPRPPTQSCPFYASSGSEVFHEESCGNVQRISPENLICYPSREAAVAGKRPGGCCKP